MIKIKINCYQEGVNRDSVEKAEMEDKFDELNKDRRTAEKKKTDIFNGATVS